MTDIFTASNGVTVNINHDEHMIVDDRIGFSAVRMRPDLVAALREYFTNERDQELGRWRDTIIPSFVIYPNGDDCIRVFSETTGIFWDADRPLRLEGIDEISWLGAAARWFAAHPEPKPWHDTQPDEPDDPIQIF